MHLQIREEREKQNEASEEADEDDNKETPEDIPDFDPFKPLNLQAVPSKTAKAESDSHADNVLASVSVTRGDGIFCVVLYVLHEHYTIGGGTVFTTASLCMD